MTDNPIHLALDKIRPGATDVTVVSEVNWNGSVSSIRWLTGTTVHNDGTVINHNFITGKDTIMTPSIFNAALAPLGAKLVAVPIYNDPNHAHYGPVRRLHLILLYLFGDDLPNVEKRFEAFCECTWDQRFVRDLAAWSEAEAAQGILLTALDVCA